MAPIAAAPSIFRPGLLAGRHAYISGGSRGINFGIAQRFCELGASVTLIGRDAAKAQDAARRLGSPQRALGLGADVRDYDAVADSLLRATAAHGPLDIVIAGAAGNFVAPAMGMSAKGFRTVVDIDLMGTFNVFRAARELVRAPGASMIAITAGLAHRPKPMQAHACAAKAGVNQLMRVLAMEWGPDGVRVNAISPGPIDGTEGAERMAPTQAARQGRIERIALRRYGRVEEVADCAVFLASDAAAYITGTILECDGGYQLGDATRVDIGEGTR
jgi:NAD(P)-dependent dehydrogenase (short-subunit alcohol dehydrogenase family)